MKGALCLTNRFSVLESCNETVVEDNTHSSTTDTTSPEPEEAAPQPVSDPPPPERILLRSARVKGSTELTLMLESTDSHQPFAAKALLDSGATGLFIDAAYAEARRLTRNRLPRSILVYNIDGTLNEHGSIKETVDLVVWYQDHTERATFFVTSLGGSQLILGHPWLVQHNPEIDWSSGKVTMSRCPDDCRIKHILTQRKHRERQKLKKKGDRAKGGRPQPVTVEELDDDDDVGEEENADEGDDWEVGDRVYSALIGEPETLRIDASSTVSTRLAEAAEKQRLKRDWKVVVPEAYHAFEKVFLKESFDELPQRRKWVHAIELVDGAEAFSTKI